MTFTLNDFIRRKVGGPIMKVSGIRGGYVTGTWYDGKTWRRDTFHYSELKLAPDPTLVAQAVG